jgi:hypothetical protein
MYIECILPFIIAINGESDWFKQPHDFNISCDMVWL